MYRRIILIGCIALCGSILTGKEVVAEQIKTLTFAVNSPGSRPYAYFDNEGQRYHGLVADFFAFTARKNLLRANFVDSNRTRSEQFLNEGKIDILLANTNWFANSENLISSMPIMQHQSYLYGLRPFSENFSLESLKHKRICTRTGFVYTGLAPFFQQQSLIRVDSSNQTAMAAMLAKGRCDYAVMNNYNAALTFSDAQFCTVTIYQSPTPTSAVPLSFVIRRDMQSVKTIIDQQLQAYIDSGEFTESLNFHSKDLHFPTTATCRAK
ncbi:ABC transporter substrate-binding protein [Paraglaciecola sp.]|uniref:substrate-binding periplasmic protein n=1 Tax=Paraglaciecola sp. TaxID=1920173 RepID=UPI00273FEBBB|nr:transporter substrate-binding domain-containing protein [Paraglaciecola sp.]MDP5032147.1 transporter substrate-binding domain-containing protein [Paraglaciecola sp.]